MVRQKKTTKERSVGFNVSMPISWVDAIDRECTAKGIDRSSWMREAASTYFPVLKDPEQIRKFLKTNNC